MTLYNLGSINTDYVYSLDHLPAPGETLRAHEFQIGLGGKGLNISVAMMRAGAPVSHIGAIGVGDTNVISMLTQQGVDLAAVDKIDGVTGHAVVYVDAQSENQIVIVGGANQAITETHIRNSLADAGPEDWLVLQNETNANELGLTVAREKGMKVALVAAPFDAQTLPDLILRVDLVSMNRSETEEFERAIGRSFREAAGPDFLLTYGSDGAEYVGSRGSARISAHTVDAVDTTGAGDTFFGSFLAKYALGLPLEEALSYANAAAALQVQRKGAAVAIPSHEEVVAFQNIAYGSGN